MSLRPARLSIPAEEQQFVQFTPSGAYVVGDFCTIDQHGFRFGPFEGTNSSSSLLVKSLDELVVEAVLGQGASGVVQRVVHEPSKRVLALKIVALDLEEKKSKQVTTELHALHSSVCPHIVEFHGAFYKERALYLVLEHMDEGSLADALKVVHVVDERYLALIAAQVLQGLVYLHEQRHIIHRDIKPANILLNSQGQVKIADFGVSGNLEGAGTWHKRTFVGTVPYMSPERILGLSHSYDSDLWSLGLTLMECALGYFPYCADRSESLDAHSPQSETPQYPLPAIFHTRLQSHISSSQSHASVMSVPPTPSDSHLPSPSQSSALSPHESPFSPFSPVNANSSLQSSSSQPHASSFSHPHASSSSQLHADSPSLAASSSQTSMDTQTTENHARNKSPGPPSSIRSILQSRRSISPLSAFHSRVRLPSPRGDGDSPRSNSGFSLPGTLLQKDIDVISALVENRTLHRNATSPLSVAIPELKEGIMSPHSRLHEETSPRAGSHDLLSLLREGSPLSVLREASHGSPATPHSRSPAWLSSEAPRRQEGRRKVGFWDILRKIWTDPAPKLPQGRFSPAFTAFLEPCLAKNPGERPTAAQLLNHEFLTGHAENGMQSMAVWVETLRTERTKRARIRSQTSNSSDNDEPTLLPPPHSQTSASKRKRNQVRFDLFPTSPLRRTPSASSSVPPLGRGHDPSRRLSHGHNFDSSPFAKPTDSQIQPLESPTRASLARAEVGEEPSEGDKEERDGVKRRRTAGE